MGAKSEKRGECVVTGNEPCFICGCEDYVGVSGNALHYMLLCNAQHTEIATIEDKKRRQTYIFKIVYREKPICLRCFEVLIGLENYYDAFWWMILNAKIRGETGNSIDEHFPLDTKTAEEAFALVRNILSDKNTLKTVAKYRGKGNYIPNSMIEKLIKCLE